MGSFPRADKPCADLGSHQKGIRAQTWQGSFRGLSGEHSEYVVLGFGFGGFLLNFLGAPMIVKAHERLGNCSA